MMRIIIVALAFATLSVPAFGEDAVPVPRDTADARPREPSMDLQDLLTQVARNSDKEFLVDTRTAPSVYVGGTPLERPDYPLLLSILRNNGLAATEIEGRVNILPAGDARQLPMRLVQRDDPEIPDDEWVSRVITVRNGSAARLVPILRPLLPRAGHLAAFGSEEHNKLLIVDRYANVRRITAIVDVLQD